MNDQPYDWMDEARGIAAECWCDKENSHKEMDVDLAEAMAKRIALWMQIASQNQMNAEYYRGLIERCGYSIGERAFIADDGSLSDTVLCAKVPELIYNDYLEKEK